MQSHAQCICNVTCSCHMSPVAYLEGAQRVAWLTLTLSFCQESKKKYVKGQWIVVRYYKLQAMIQRVGRFNHYWIEVAFPYKKNEKKNFDFNSCFYKIYKNYVLYTRRAYTEITICVISIRENLFPDHICIQDIEQIKKFTLTIIYQYVIRVSLGFWAHWAWTLHC